MMRAFSTGPCCSNRVRNWRSLVSSVRNLTISWRCSATAVLLADMSKWRPDAEPLTELWRPPLRECDPRVVAAPLSPLLLLLLSPSVWELPLWVWAPVPLLVVGVGVGDGLEAAFTVDVGPAPPPPGSAPAPLKALSGMKPAIPGHMAGGTGADGCGNGDVALPFAPLPAYGIGAGGNAPVAVMGGTPGKAPPAYGIAPKGGIMAYGFPKPAAGGKPAGHPFGAKPAPFVPFAPAVNEVVAPLVCGTGARAAFDPACLLSAGANVCVDDIFQLRSFAVEDEQQEVSKGVTTAAEWICAVSGGTTGSASTPQKNGSQGDGPACERETGGNCFAREKSAPLRTTVCCQAVAFRLGDENAGTVRVSSTGHRRVLALFVLTASTLDRKGFS
mmetsp:Transcript_2019/g.6316  ORF Transcript_2019/g.6316 Transcript_2019/m.6316 type:complete len:387 (-) Transcript_2019:551-1711(-)